jgi:hypothetical protein
VAAGSELVNSIWLSITVSRWSSYTTVTVTVKGVPAVTVEGAVKLRVARVVPQPNVINAARTTHNAQRPRNGTFSRVKRRYFAEHLESRRRRLLIKLDNSYPLVSRGTKTAMSRFQSPNLSLALYWVAWWGLPNRTSRPNMGP